MANDISKAISDQPIKNDTLLASTIKTGSTSKLNTYVSNKPTISDIEAKHDNRFYNGIFVKVLS